MAMRLGLIGVMAVVMADPLPALTAGRPTPRTTSPRRAQPLVPLNLKVRRLPQAVEVVIEGAGATAEIAGFQTGLGWEGELIPAAPAQLMVNPQVISLADSALNRITLSNTGTVYRLFVEPVEGFPVASPIVSGNGNDLILRFPAVGPRQMQTAQFNATQPGRLADPSFVPPLRPRAIAPPLGDMAIGTMALPNRGFVRLSGPPVTMTLKNAPAQDALMTLAQLGGYGFAFSEGGSPANNSGSGSGSGSGGLINPVTVSFRNEAYERAFNFVLLSSGLQGRLEGRTVLVGTSVLSQTLGTQMSRVYRLNQVSAAGAADYLANLGAQITKTNTITITANEGTSTGTGQGAGSGGSTTSQSTTEATTRTVIDAYGASTGPLLGLQGTTDSRLGTITLIGEPQMITIAESYLKQLDLRKRQVAVKVQILNVDLLNDKQIDASFSSRIGNTFIVSEGGKAFMNFGSNRPGSSAGTGTLSDGSPFTTPGAYQAGIPRVQQQTVVRPQVAEQRQVVGPDGTISFEPVLDSLGRQVFAPTLDPSLSSIEVPLFDQLGRPVYVPGRDPGRYRQPDNSFYAFLEAVIESKSAKTLAEPTLLVQEGQKAQVKQATSVITGVDSTEAANGSVQFSNTREDAGLILDIDVSKVDDNGFISLTLEPRVSVPVPAGAQEGVPIFNIQERSVSSGLVRLRDGQTLVLTGVITDSDRQQVSKWPILGDLPLIGQLFRQTSGARERNELVILVTPSVVSDGEGGVFGYGYTPSARAAQELMR